MQKTDFIWHKGQFTSWDEAQIHVLTHTLHYGGGVFEGIRVYQTDKGPAIFKLEEHVARLFYSASAINMRLNYTQDEVIDIIIQLVRKNRLDSGYIRPLVFYGYGEMGVNPQDNPIELSIACWPWGQYLPDQGVKVQASRFIRIHPDSTVADAKFCGHYLNSMLAVIALDKTRYQEALLLDHQGNIAEGPSANIFFVKKGVLYTPSPGSILPGLTRETVLDIARSHDIPIEEKQLTLDDAYQANEAFFCGTAVEITPILSIDEYIINAQGFGKVGALIKDEYHNIVRGKHPGYAQHLTWVNPKT